MCTYAVFNAFLSGRGLSRIDVMFTLQYFHSTSITQILSGAFVFLILACLSVWLTVLFQLLLVLSTFCKVDSTKSEESSATL